MTSKSRLLEAPASVLAVVVFCASIAIQAILIANSYDDRWSQAVSNAESMLNITAADIERNIQIIDKSLIAMTDTVENIDLSGMTSPARNKILFSGIAPAESVGGAIILSKDGAVIYDSVSPTPRPTNFKDRDYFKVHQNKATGLYIGGPFSVASRGGEKVMILSRGIYAADGSFNGEAIVSLKLSYFLDFFDKVDLGKNDYIALMDREGRIFARVPSADGKGGIGISAKDAAAPGRAQRDWITRFSADTPMDGIRRQFLAKELGSYPLVLVIGFSTEAVLKNWAKRVSVLLALTLVTSAIGLWLVIALRRSLRRQYSVEDKLIALADTDSLTGLANRRAFDSRLVQEWLRASRDGTQLSLLLVDLDSFKIVNDTMGHSAGDNLLRLIGSEIQASIHRPADLCARFGGEEFAVILPSTDMAGALAIAERLRSNIEVATTAYRSHGHTVGTASIGVATAKPKSHDVEDVLLNAADKALYRAKDGGRNRVCGLAVDLGSPLRLVR